MAETSAPWRINQSSDSFGQYIKPPRGPSFSCLLIQLFPFTSSKLLSLSRATPCAQSLYQTAHFFAERTFKPLATARKFSSKPLHQPRKFANRHPKHSKPLQTLCVKPTTIVGRSSSNDRPESSHCSHRHGSALRDA